MKLSECDFGEREKYQTHKKYQKQQQQQQTFTETKQWGAKAKNKNEKRGREREREMCVWLCGRKDQQSVTNSWHMTRVLKNTFLQSCTHPAHLEEIQWLYLTCDLPPPPLYPDEARENIIPQVPFASLLAKFNGTTEKEYKTYKDNTLKRFQLTRLPPFIICYFKVRLCEQTM